VKAKRAGKHENTQLRNENKGDVLRLESTRGRPPKSAKAWAGSTWKHKGKEAKVNGE